MRENEAPYKPIVEIDLVESDTEVQRQLNAQAMKEAAAGANAAAAAAAAAAATDAPTKAKPPESFPNKLHQQKRKVSTHLRSCGRMGLPTVHGSLAIWPPNAAATHTRRST